MTTCKPPDADFESPFETMVPTYERWVHPAAASLAETVISRLRLSPGMVVLDVGAGLGNFAVPASARGVAVAAVDNSPAMVARLRERLAPFPQSRADLKSLYNLAFDEPAFDATVSLFCAAFMPDARDVFARLARMTKPGGTVCVNSWASSYGGPMFEILYRALQALPVPDAKPTSPGLIELSRPATLQRALQDAGCREVAVNTVSLNCPLPLPRDFLDEFDPLFQVVPPYRQLSPSNKQRLQPLIEREFAALPSTNGTYTVSSQANVAIGTVA